jgi:phage-related minor tail protein
MAVLGSAEVELVLDPGNAGASAERELTAQLETAGRKAGDRLEDALTDAGKRAGKAVAADVGDGLEAGTGAAGKRAGAKLDAALSAAGKQAGRRAGQEAGEGVEEGVDRGTRGIGPKGVAAGVALGEGIAGAAEAALGSLGELVGQALDQADLPGQLRAKLGTGEAESAALGKTAGAIYAANYGDSLEQVGEAITLVRRQTALLGSDGRGDLQGLAEKALTVSTVFGQDLNETIRAAAQLVKTGLAPNAQAAFDVLTRGFQVGNDVAGDLLDTVTEYSTQFRVVGVSGAQAMGILQQGLQGGARDADKVADAIKEFAIRSVDGSALTAAGFRALGLDAGVMAQRIAAGGKTANGALDETLDRLRAIPDPVKRSQVAVALFGAQSEDLQAALAAVDPSTAVAGLGQVAGAADRAGEAVASGPRAELNAFARDVQSKVVGVLGTVVGELSDLPGPAQAVVGTVGGATAAIGGLAAVAGTLGPKIKAGREQLAGYGPAGEKANAALGKVGRTVAVAGAAFAVFEVASFAVDKLQASLVKTPVAVDTLTKSLLAARSGADITRALSTEVDGLGKSIKEVVSPDGEAKLRRVLTGAIGKESRVYKDAKTDISSLDSALTQLVNSGNADEAARQYQLIVDAAAKGGASVDEVKKALPGYANALAAVSNEATLNSKAQDKQGQAIAGATGDMSEQLSTAERLTRALDDLSGAAVDNTRADIAVRDAKARLTQSLKENGKSLDLNTPKGRENASALLDARDAAARYAEAQEKLHPGIGRGTAAFKEYAGQLVAVLRAAGVSEAEIKRFTSTVLAVPKGPVGPKVDAPGAESAKSKMDAATRAANAIPGRKSTSVDAPGAVSAAAKMSATQRAANSIPGSKLTVLRADDRASREIASVRAAIARVPTYKSVIVQVASRGVGAVQREINSITGKSVAIIVGSVRGNGVQARMAGGPVVGGEPYLVGEAGPEIVVPAQSGTVIPNDKAFGQAAALGIGGGPVELGPPTIRALAALLERAAAGDVLLGREKVGQSVSRTVGASLYRQGVGR